MSMSTISTMSHPPCPRPHFGQVMFYFQIVLTLSFFCVRFSTFQYFTLFNIVVDLCWLCPFFMFVLAFLCILLDLCWFCQFFVQALTFTFFKGLSQVTDLNIWYICIIYIYIYISWRSPCHQIWGWMQKQNQRRGQPGKKALCFHFDICSAIAMYGGVKTRGCH